MVKTAKLLNEVYDRLQDEEAIVYAIGAMQPIDPEYSAFCFFDCQRVQRTIGPAAGKAGIPTAFRYQGSITNDTHIKAHSDIDLLVIDMNFTTLESPQKTTTLYIGNSVEDLRTLRNLSVEAVKTGLPEVDVNPSGAFSVSLSGGGLQQVINLLFANWYNTNDYITHQQEKFRGLNMLDSDQARRVLKFPFLHNALIEEKDDHSNGSIRKLVRLLKSLLYDAKEKYGLSGYDITSLIWNMPEKNLAYGHGQELQLIHSAYDYLIYLLTNEAYRNNLKVPDGTRTVFGLDGATKNQLRVTSNHLGLLSKDIKQAIQRSSRDLAGVRIEY
jgi:hypothetical protein